MYDVAMHNTVPPCTQGAIRLEGGTAIGGRVEICNNRVWGTVCNDSFGNEEAIVACRQLGFENSCKPIRMHYLLHYRYIRTLYTLAFYLAAQVISSLQFGTSTGQIWLDEVSCNGSEETLLNCSHSPLGTHDCSHSDDVGLMCPPIPGKKFCTAWQHV